MTDIGVLFEEFTARYRAGEAPDTYDYLERAGSMADELATMMATFLEAAPPPPVHETRLGGILEHPAIAALGEAEFAAALTATRKQRGETRASFSRNLADSLGVAHKAAKVKRYYADLENGLLSPAGLHNRVVRALAELLGLPESSVDGARLTWRPRHPPLARPSYLRAVGAPPKMRRASDRPVERDEVDELFLGGM